MLNYTRVSILVMVELLRKEEQSMRAKSSDMRSFNPCYGGIAS